MKIVRNALREELQARRAAGQGAAGSADDAPVLPTSATAGAHLKRDEQNANKERQHARPLADSPRAGVLVHLSDNALAAPESSTVAPRAKFKAGERLINRAIPDVVVPFRVSDEPLVPLAPYLVIAVLTAAAAAVLMFIAL